MDLLKDGIIAYPAPLQLQCLMYLVGHLDELSSSVVSLLPRHVRHELLLLLPAVDVCQLEGTRVTVDILMDDIWHTLYNNRIGGLADFTSYRLQEEMADCVSLSWKDKYFNVFFFWSQFKWCESKIRTDCECIRKHVCTAVFYVLYAVYELEKSSYSCYYNPNFTGYQCFSSHTQSVQGLTRYTEQCAHLIPMRYKNKIFPSDIDLLKILVDVCQFSFKIFDSTLRPRTINVDHFYVKLFSTIEGMIFDWDYHNIQHFVDLIFLNPVYNIKLKSVVITYTLSPLIVQCLTSSTCSSLKQLILCESQAVNSDMIEIIESLQSLEKLTLMFFYLTDVNIPTFIMKLFKRSSFKELYIKYCTLSFEYLYGILELFLMSPYSISLKLKHVLALKPSVLPTEIIPNATQHSKSITITDCDIPPELLSMIPEEFCHYIPPEL